MHSLVTVVSVLRWLIAAFFVLCVLHPAKADSLTVKHAGSESGYITTYCYPPTGHVFK